MPEKTKNQKTKNQKTKNQNKNVTIIKIPKNDGSFRTIYIPSNDIDSKLKSVLKKIRVISFPPHVCAFNRGRNIANYIRPHLSRIAVNKAMSFDIYKCFDSINKNNILDGLSYIEKASIADKKTCNTIKENIDNLLYKGFLPQGFRTSPSLSNIALLPIDNEIIDMLRTEIGEDVVYTRYADNLLISSLKLSYDPEFRSYIAERIDDILKKHGLRLNTDKTKLYVKSNQGFCKICGISIDINNKIMRATKKIRHKIRGLTHLADKYKKFNKSKLNGYIGFANMIH